MSQAYSIDLRQRVISACNEGQSASAVAARFSVSVSFIEKLKRQRRERGTLAPKPHAGGGRPLLAEYDEAIRAYLNAKPDTTLAELREVLEVKVQLSTLWYHLDRLGLTFKKTLRAGEQDREDVRLARAHWQAEQGTLNAAQLVFIDETFVTTAMTRRYGWGPRGERVIGTVPQGQRQTITFVAALRQEGVTAPMITEGPMNGELFLAYVPEFICPTLVPGNVVIWDNLSSHQVKGVREAIEACGAKVMPLPPYSPDFNPIEQVFAKFKARLRQASQRTLDAVETTMGTLLSQFTPGECVNDFRNAGYAV